VARDVRDLVKKPPEGIRLVLDDETGMPGSLSEIMVRLYLFIGFCGVGVDCCVVDEVDSYCSLGGSIYFGLA